MPARAAEEVHISNEFVTTVENLVLAKQQAPTGDRNTLLMAYWSLAFEIHRGILSLIDQKFFGAAFALVRPIFEAALRAHIALSGSDNVIGQLHADTYQTNFGTVGKEIDTAFGLDGFFENLLKRTKNALHSYTHAGVHQLGRRFTGIDLAANYNEDEIVEVIRSCTSCVFMVNNLMTKHFKWEEEWKQNTELFVEWGKHPNDRKATPSWMQLPAVYQKAEHD
jgi:hypothetical protein